MSVALTVTRGANGGGLTPTQSRSYSGSSVVVVSRQIAASTSNVEVDLTAAMANIVALHIQSDQDVTLKLNSSGSPDQTLTIKANAPLAWGSDDAVSMPLTHDVTKFFFSNAGGVAANVQVAILLA